MDILQKNKVVNWQVFPGFQIEHLVGELNLPVNIAFSKKLPEKDGDPLLYISELYGQIKVVSKDYSVRTYAKNLLNYKPDYRFPGSGESGVTGIVVEPISGDLFASMIYENEGTLKSKVVRFHSSDGLRSLNQNVIIDNIPSVHAAHQIQALTIGFDGKLYVNLGDGMVKPNPAQDESDLRGKILRMNFDGSIPKDNPNPKSYIFAKGFRNPFGAVWRNSDKSLYITDNGPDNDDRIAKVLPGGNYGWPDSIRESSLFYWDYTQAPTALDFCQNDQFPEKYHDELFVSLYGYAYMKGRQVKGKKIVKMKLNKNGLGIVSYDEFAIYIGEGPAAPCGLSFGPDGLYFTDLHGDLGEKTDKPTGNLYRIKPVIQSESG